MHGVEHAVCFFCIYNCTVPMSNTHRFSPCSISSTPPDSRIRDSAVGLGTGLQAWVSWVWFPMASLKFFFDLIIPADPSGRTVWDKGVQLLACWWFVPCWGHGCLRCLLYGKDKMHKPKQWRQRNKYGKRTKSEKENYSRKWDGVFEIFHRLNLSGRTMALGSTQPLTEINTRNIPWGVKAVSE